MSIGTDADSLDDTFFRHAELDNGFIRVGMSPAAAREEARQDGVQAAMPVRVRTSASALNSARMRSLESRFLR